MKADINLALFLEGDTALLAKHIKLLKAIDKTKSITKAAKEEDISYKNAWDSLDILNNKSKFPLIVRASGNRKNSGSELSDYAKKLIKTYDAILKAQKAFLDEICKDEDINENTIMQLAKMNIKLSARNQLLVTITDIKTGAVNSQITAKLSSGETLKANITVESQQNLGLSVGKEVLFLFKAPSVILSKDELNGTQISAENQLKGKVLEAKLGSVNAEICVQIGQHQKIVSIITNRSAADMGISVGDNITAMIKANDILVGA
ncbi:LysR family transcriptional regulator [Campylobacter hyointestinalis subsp. hyointestinalis]|uniref:TOBE domain-containing protein n=1 Tax=Campylobacter hyointestinalis TaxID=198 RepID=UPI000723B88B|nr:TOBE domain-containing protein [Campylobacter hyointestinalis]PPB58358.1 molybdenum-dependent transcriptional regulator [Campylobacter hyointestinalis subsp. hyointestinalis]QCU00433.1 LysR family transcriptional regulator [Campylobacter hyointestinalis subsp. hyointestinalis]CUU80189.1 ModE family transcriptional regulator [Campylobacter hyointestinalis subsp. hyointestinalis]